MSDKKILTREEIRSFKRKTIEVECPDLGGGTIILRALSVGQLKHIGDSNDVARQLSLMIVDAEGNLLFGDDAGIAELSELSASTATALITAAAKVNGIGQAAVDEAVKNLLASPNNASVTD